MNTCSTIRGSFLQFNQTTSQKSCTDMAETAIIITLNPNNKNHNSNTIIISNLTNLTKNDTHQPLLFDRNASYSRPLPRMLKTVITRNSSMLQNSTRHSCSRLKGHYLQGHLQTSKMMYVPCQKICNLLTQSGQSGFSVITYSWKLRLPGHLKTSELYVQYRKSCNLFTQSGQSRTVITYSWKLRPLAHSIANHQHAVCPSSHYLPFNHPIGSKRICHLVILLEIKTTKSTANFQNCCSISHHLPSNHPIGPKRTCHLSTILPETDETTKSTANFQNVVCSQSHNLLLNHPIGPKQICHHSIRLEIKPATLQNVVCSISQTLLLIHPIGPKRIAITYSWIPRLLDTLARIFNNPNKDETVTIQRQSGDGDSGSGIADDKDNDATYDEDEDFLELVSYYKTRGAA